MSWFVLHCRSGNERELISSCRQHISREILKEAFLFQYQRVRRYEGSWHQETNILFPGYVFLESCEEQALSKALEPYRSIVRVMEEKGTLIPVYEREERFLREFCGKYHLMEMSHGYMKEGIPHVTDGPLRGRENHICKIDRHKRLATILVPLEHREVMVKVGLEIVNKF